MRRGARGGFEELFGLLEFAHFPEDRAEIAERARIVMLA